MADATSTISVVRGAAPTGADAPAAQLVVALACHAPCVAPSRHLLGETDAVMIIRRKGDPGWRVWDRDRRAGQRRLVIGVSDRGLSNEHARLVQLHGRWVLEDLGSKNGTLVNGRRVTRAVLQDGDLIELASTFLQFRDAVPPVPGPADASADELGAPQPRLQTFLARLARGYGELAKIARSDLPILIFGPTGSGKEVAAAAVHELSERRGAFVPVNCGAIAPGLVEAELFGHRRGAFSGAIEDRDGFVRSAERGTLFLDEVAELPATSQVALLRVLQERQVTPVGGSRPVRVDVRVVAATHRDLGARVADGSFREDLLARLNGFSLRLPPLAERREDLGLLVGLLLARAGRDATLSPEAARAIFFHPWPRNARELDLALQGAVALAGARRIELDDLPEPVRMSFLAGATGGREQPLDGAEAALRDKLVRSLTDHAGNLSAVARELGKGRTQVRRWIARFGLDPSKLRR